MEIFYRSRLTEAINGAIKPNSSGALEFVGRFGDVKVNFFGPIIKIFK